MTVNAAPAPERTCVGCRRVRPKHDLVRLARDGTLVVVDVHAVRPGRGAYVCPDPACIRAAGRRGARSLQRALPGVTEAAVSVLEAAQREVAP